MVLLRPQRPNEMENCIDFWFFWFVAVDLSGKEKLAVIFFVHGGGYMSGSSVWMGPDMLLDEDIVLVTINYRLGPFGFLSLHLPEYSGNMGLKDQLMALQWVNENIGNFGGDQSRITIWGQSTGASSVHLHTLIPQAQNLFQRAIISSGSILNPWSRSAHNHTEIISKVIAQEKGINENDVGIDDIIEWLRTTDGSHIGSQTFFKVYECGQNVKQIDLKWAPVMESEHDVDAIFTKPIESYMQETTDIDTLFGYTSAVNCIEITYC